MLLLWKDLHYYLFLLTKRNPKENFPFYEKRQKVKIAFSICFVVSCYRGTCTPSSKWHHQAPSLGTTLSISSSSHHSFELCLWVSEFYRNLLCASLSKMCPFFALQHFHSERSQRNSPLDSWGNLYSLTVLLRSLVINFLAFQILVTCVFPLFGGLIIVYNLFKWLAFILVSLIFLYSFSVFNFIYFCSSIISSLFLFWVCVALLFLVS